ncbi:MAG TPA: Flp family type IVb pilin [Anaerolineae bacterium]|nr:Flp family type IVb pilin [Anaerolineae bacterium]HOR01230.1 Flp family type IVb pilin [Anaerolineae bacterium]HPL29391.1 Flp family type IVb pilin [Anaerolineae bacterium]
MLQYFRTWLRTTALYQTIKSEEGQDLAEYALLIGLIAVVIVGAVVLLGEQIETTFENIRNGLLGIEAPAGG